MRQILKYSSFLITSLLVILAFVTSTTYTQLGVAIVLFPLIAFFAFKLFVVKNEKALEISVKLPPVIPAEKTEVKIAEVKKEDVSVADLNKRAFLKVIGATGISFFLFSLLNRRTQGLFFGSGQSTSLGLAALSDVTGQKINPAERQPTDSYLISEIDDSYVAFYGFTGKNGSWFIMKENPDDGSFRYTRGDSNFPNNWTNRNNLKYDYYNNVFPL
jgi:hypothetical protein